MMSPELVERWSLVAVCSRCGARTLIFKNLPEKLSHIQGKYLIQCEVCDHKDAFPIERVKTASVGSSDGAMRQTGQH